MKLWFVQRSGPRRWTVRDHYDKTHNVGYVQGSTIGAAAAGAAFILTLLHPENHTSVLAEPHFAIVPALTPSHATSQRRSLQIAARTAASASQGQ